MSIAIFPPDPEVEKRERLRAIAYGRTEADADMTGGMGCNASIFAAAEAAVLLIRAAATVNVRIQTYSVNDAPSPSEIDAIVMYADDASRLGAALGLRRAPGHVLPTYTGSLDGDTAIIVTACHKYDRPAAKATAETLAWGAEARVYDGPTDWVGRPATEAGVRA